MNKKRFKKIYVEITNSCNLNCSFCPETKRTKEFIEIEDFRHIIDEIKEYTNLIALHVKGEPLLHPKLGEILQNYVKLKQQLRKFM
ncbi:MAG: radical SAM protein, partial [bacterium]|nr:radical SAM protein [bacterium]